MSKGIFDIILDSIFDAQWTGKRGEKLTERELNLVKLLGRGGKVLRNLYVPKNNGETSEIDVVFITQKGIFVIESKNYSGWIFGDEKSYYWTSVLPNKQKNKFYNPIKQNATHIKWLGEYVGKDIPLFSIIAFSERCELKKITVEDCNVKVIKRDRIYVTIRSIWDNVADVMSEDEVNCLYEGLKKLTEVDYATKMEHISNIDFKYKNNNDVQNICPRCGAKLIVRTAKKGTNAGKQFYGCSNFPNCRYTSEIAN